MINPIKLFFMILALILIITFFLFIIKNIYLNKIEICEEYLDKSNQSYFNQLTNKSLITFNYIEQYCKNIINENGTSKRIFK